MLEDFIEANKLRARLTQNSVKSRQIRCTLFLSGGREILAVHLANDNPRQHVLSKLISTAEMQRAKPVQIETMTGYTAEFLPPISIYGVEVLLDEKLSRYDRLYCRISEEQFLEIAPEEIIVSNENAKVAKLT